MQSKISHVRVACATNSTSACMLYLTPSTDIQYSTCMRFPYFRFPRRELSSACASALTHAHHHHDSVLHAGAYRCDSLVCQRASNLREHLSGLFSVTALDSGQDVNIPRSGQVLVPACPRTGRSQRGSICRPQSQYPCARCYTRAYRHPGPETLPSSSQARGNGRTLTVQ